MDRLERADAAVGQCINLDRNLAAEIHRLVLVKRQYQVVRGTVTTVVVAGVEIVVAMMMVLEAVVSNVQGCDCDLVRIECSNYLYMQLLEMNFFLEVSRNGSI